MTIPSGPHLLPRELAKLCYNAGWIDAQRLLEAISVIIAESNGYVERKGPVHADGTVGNTDGSIDRGLWALNSLAHPDVTDAVAYDPILSTKVARGIFLKQGWHPWASVANGQYKGPRAMGYAFDGVANFLRERNGFPVK